MINIKGKKILILGIGALGKAISYYLDQFFNYDKSKLIMIDKVVVDFPTINALKKEGANILRIEITSKNVGTLINMLGEGDIFIDCSTRTPTYKILTLCREKGIFYINTSIEEEDMGEKAKTLEDESIMLQHESIFKIRQKTKDKKVTSIIEYGMNPGLISAFTLKALDDLAKHLKVTHTSYRECAEKCKVRVVHCSEVDTQLAKNYDICKLNNTWSCVGMLDESSECAEIVLGSHEKVNNSSEIEIHKFDKSKVMLTKKRGGTLKAKSICFNEAITGVVIHHGEGLDLARKLSSFTYSPTIHYVYKINPIAKYKIDFSNSYGVNLVEDSYDPNNWHVMNNYENQLSGYDNVGCLLILENGSTYWCGSCLDNKFVKNNLKDKYFGATMIQVVAGLLGALSWAIENPNEGICFGTDVDYHYVLKKSGHMLGKIISEFTNIKMPILLNKLLI